MPAWQTSGFSSRLQKNVNDTGKYVRLSDLNKLEFSI